MAKKFYRSDLEKGYYIEYREVSNGYGGMHRVNMMLYKDDGVFVKEITDTEGSFMDFPGTEEGEWQDKLVGELISQVRFRSYIKRINDNTFLFAWQVQPDGRYWSDEQGFGMEDDEEIWLYAPMNQRGDFEGPFSEKVFEQREG